MQDKFYVILSTLRMTIFFMFLLLPAFTWSQGTVGPPSGETYPDTVTYNISSSSSPLIDLQYNDILHYVGSYNAYILNVTEPTDIEATVTYFTIGREFSQDEDSILNIRLELSTYADMSTSPGRDNLCLQMNLEWNWRHNSLAHCSDHIGVLPVGKYLLRFTGYEVDESAYLMSLLDASTPQLRVGNNFFTLSEIKVRLNCGVEYYPYDVTEEMEYPLILSADMSAPIALSSTEGKNTIVKFTSLDGTSSVGNKTVEYYNALGYKEETVAVESSTGIDLVSYQEYQSISRLGNAWQPTPVTSQGGGYVSCNDVSQAAVTVYSDAAPFTSTEYEPSPLNRITSQTGAGSDWHMNGKSVTTGYDTNAQSGLLRCHVLSYDSDTGIHVDSLYPTGRLEVTSVTDEDGYAVYTFTNSEGKTVLLRKARQGSETDCLDTYYVYNASGNLTAVLPPAISATLSAGQVSGQLIDDYAYLYHYDNRQRVVAKKLPGCEWTLMRYDDVGNLVFTQDGNMRTEGLWHYTLPDDYGRPLMEGTCAAPIENVENICVKAFYFPWDFLFADYTGYSLDEDSVLHVNFYDNYSYLAEDVVSPQHVQPLSSIQMQGYGEIDPYPTAAIGLLTGKMTKVLNDSTHTRLYTFYYYDDRGRMVQSHAMNHLGGYDHDYYAYDYTGNVTKHKHVHTTSFTQPLTEEYLYTYDNWGRLLTTSHSLNGEPSVTLSSNTYDNLGQLSAKSLGCGENISYAYNVRGWLTETVSSKFFEKLSYNTATDGGTLTTPCYNGNISAKSWKVGTGTTHRYEFAYDNHARLATANYADAGRYNESYTYDCMGNVTSLQRYGSRTTSGYGLLDDLIYIYDGNHITKITNDMQQVFTNSAYHYEDNSDANTEFEYDANGNMTRYADRRITSISYNLLNLPEEISMLDDNQISYCYDTEGNKLHVKYRISPFQTLYPGYAIAQDAEGYDMEGSLGSGDELFGGIRDTSAVIGPIGGGEINLLEDTHLTNDYCGNIVYEDSVLKMVLLPEGLYAKAGNTYYYNYYLKDHLGSNCVVLGNTGVIRQRLNYYPSGWPMSKLSALANQRYMFQGKEFDMMHGLRWHDHGARFADNTILRWTTMDPLCEKYYDTSPYVFCGDNPIKYVDPNGKDLYKLTTDGYIIYLYSTNDNYHTIYSSNQQGEINYNNSIRINKYILSNEYNQTILGRASKTKGGRISEYRITSYSSRNYEEMYDMFLFVVNNTDVEWSLFSTSKNDEKAILSTSHSFGDDASALPISDRIYSSNEKIHKFTHSHSLGNYVLSEGDINVAKQMRRKHENICFFIYDRENFITYDEYSEHSTLDDIIITP